MGKNHLSRLTAPKSWPLKRKETKWIARPRSPHKLKKCITLNLVLKDLLSFVKTTKEVKKILNDKKVLVDKKFRKDHKFAPGIMDVIEVPAINKSYRLLLNKKGAFFLAEIKNTETTVKPCKVIGKKCLKGKKLQLNLYDGKNILTDKNICNVGDTVLFDLTKNKINDVLKLEKKSIVYLTDGKYVGEIGVVEDILKFKSKEDEITFKLDGNLVKTLKKYAFVIGKDKPFIQIK